MIVKMKKLTLLCLASDQDRTLEALRDMGVVHLSHVQPPKGDDLEKARTRLSYVQRALEVLPKRPQEQPSGRPVDKIVDDIWELIHEKKELLETLERVKHERKRIEPFGLFYPSSIRDLAEKGIVVKLYQVSPNQMPAIPEGAVFSEITRTKECVCFAVIGRTDFTVAAPELRLPEQSLDALDTQIKETEKALVDNEQSLGHHAGDYQAVACTVRETTELVQYLEAREGMGMARKVAYLQGYCPAEELPRIQSAVAQYGWGLIVEDPPAGDGAPTLIRNPVWVKPIKAVFDFIGVLPGYEEIDISVVFLFFLSLFFAMLVGDAGYGLIFLGLTFWARRKMPKAPGYPFHLLYIMSICTIVWGAVTGTWFGAERLPAILNGLTVAWLKEPKNIMLLCFTIGAVHLTIAHLWNIARAWNSLKALAQFGWICSTWTMYFMARNLVLGQPLPGWIGWLFISGVVLIILFMTAPRDFKNEWFNHVMLPLNLVSNFVDVVSYIRLFAVGTAGYAVASSFNKMILGGGVEGILAGLVAALLLFVGHALNIILCVMGVLVHGVRLNTLEFSSHIGMAWTGILFKPFARLDSAEQKK